MGKTSKDYLSEVLRVNLTDTEYEWLTTAVEKILDSRSKKELYITYSLSTSKIQDRPITDFGEKDFAWKTYLELQEASTLEISRIYLLIAALQSDDNFLQPVQQLIQVADKTELETFLKYLILLPNAEHFKFVAVEALRTNIANVFNAISQNNPYPSKFFETEEWNQMYLKAAFMQQNLKKIPEIDTMANKELARIISDYAHERWAASRSVDPLFWRPVSNFLDESLLKDIERLFQSEDKREQKAATLVCYNSESEKAKKLLNQYDTYFQAVENGDLNWKNIE
ncbi:EboA domain-containing protein [Flagellimonas iocasae]|uniref:EboA domain-containing protein n=1 Tax=Flagellimonas iocasae TaxID=2055905 RepID=A0ABW4Y172_9FLAO